jgi:GntR family transcriptional regulator
MSIAGPLDKNLPVPLYHQLGGILKADIESGKWRSGDQLPTESNLAEQFGISKITVRQALEELVELGYIRREQGRGTFVAPRKFAEGPRGLTSFTDEMKRHELVASSRVLSQSIAEADAKVADALGVPVKSEIFVLRRVRLASGEAVTVQTAHLPAAFVPGLKVDDGASLYDILQRRFHLHPARAREVYFAAAADKQAAKLLGIPAGSPVFTVERVTFLPNEKPFEFVQSVVRGDRYSIVLDLIKQDEFKPVLRLGNGVTAGVR